MLTREQKVGLVKEYAMMIAFLVMIGLQIWLGAKWTIPIWVFCIVVNCALLATNYVEQNFDSFLIFILSGALFAMLGPLTLISLFVQNVLYSIVFKDEARH
jgi:hypothetical protein